MGRQGRFPVSRTSREEGEGKLEARPACDEQFDDPQIQGIKPFDFSVAQKRARKGTWPEEKDKATGTDREIESNNWGTKGLIVLPIVLSEQWTVASPRCKRKLAKTRFLRGVGRMEGKTWTRRA